MQRLSRLVVPRVTVLGGLASLAIVLHGLSLLQPAPWAAPSLVATERGFLVGWLDGSSDRVPLRVQAVARDLQARGATHAVGMGWAGARVLLEREAGGETAVRLVGDPAHPSWRVLATIDADGRPRVRSGFAPRSPGEIRALPESGNLLRPARCHAIGGTTVRDANGDVQARLALSPGGYARLERVPNGPAVPSDRIGPASCPGLSVGPCFAAAADERGVVVAWTRNRALGAELVLTRLGRHPREMVVRRAPSFVLATVVAAFIALVAGLVGHAMSRAVEILRLLGVLVRRRGWVWADGRPDEPADLVAGAATGRSASTFRMRTAASWLQSESGERIALRAGTPLVVTRRALLGEIPALAATAAGLEHVWVAGHACGDVPRLGPYRGEGERVVSPEVVSDRPLPALRGAVLARLLWSVLDAAALVAIGLGAFAAIL